MQILKILLIFTLAENPLNTALQPGLWGGTLFHGEQATEFYLEFRFDENDSITAFLTLPVTNFHELSIGEVKSSEEYLTAGSLQFLFNENGSEITGRFNRSDRELTYRLKPVDLIPKKKKTEVGESTAEPAWTFQTGGAVWGDTATDGESIYIGSTDGNLYTLDSVTGKLNWAIKTGGPIFSRPLLYGEYIYTLSDDEFLYKLNKKSGRQAWAFETEASEWVRGLPDHEEPGYDSMSSAPVIVGDVIYVGSSNGHVYAIHKDSGEEVWRYQTGGPVLSVPAIEDGALFIGSNDHHLYALNANTGELIWKFDTGQVVISSPVVHKGLVIVGSRSADLFALNTKTGEPAWSRFYWFSWVESSGVIHDDLLYIGSSDNQLLQSYHPEDGTLIWSYDTGGSPWTTPAVTEKSVFSGVFGNSNYFIEHRGGFVAVDRVSGNERWRYVMNELPDTHIYGVVSSPAVAKGMVFFGGLDGVVYGFRQ